MKADPTTEAEVWALCERMNAEYMGRNARNYMAFWAPDEDIAYIGSGPDEIGTGHEQIAALVALSTSEPESIVGSDRWHTVSREGPVSWVTGEFDLRAVIDGAELDFRFRYTWTFVRRDGKWLSVNAHFSVPDRASVEEGRVWPTSLDEVASVVAREQPDLGASAAPDGMVTLLFSDIEASTEMTERLGDLRWIDVIREHNAIVRERVAAHGGFEVKTIGDAFMVAFQSARRAMMCAIDLQRAFAAYSREHPDSGIRVRVGLHAGEPVREGGDFYGKSVVVASRIAAQARGGEILVSSLVQELVESAGDITFGEMRMTELKGFARPYAVVPVDWEL